MEPPSTCPEASGDALFQSAFKFAAIGMALVAPDGTWLMVNKALCAITGYTEEELLQRTFQSITHPEDVAIDLSNAAKMLTGETATYQVEKRYIHKSGSTVWVLLSVSLVRDDKGDACFFISQMQDVTSRKESERRLGEAALEIERLRQGLVKICDWTKRIEVEGRWISVDEFLQKRLGLNLTHAVSIEGAHSPSD